MLKVKNLEVYYGLIKAVKGINFEVKEGQIVSLVGSNGAGKSSIGPEYVPNKLRDSIFDGDKLFMEKKSGNCPSTCSKSTAFTFR